MARSDQPDHQLVTRYEQNPDSADWAIFMGKIIMAQPSPLSALSRANESWSRRSGRIRFECKRLGQGKSLAAVMSVRSCANDRRLLAEAEYGRVHFKRGSPQLTDGNALPNRDPPDVTRFRSATAKRVQAHRSTGPHGAAVPHGTGQRPHSAPSDQHRLSLPGEP